MTEALPVPLPPKDDKDKIASTEATYKESDESSVNIDPEIEKRVVRKCDLRVVPPTLVLFALSFLDRVNIGNAAIQGIPQDLQLTGSMFNVALLILFVPFILLEVPSNLVMKQLRPSTWLSVLLFGCGRFPTDRSNNQATPANRRVKHHEHVHGLCAIVCCLGRGVVPARRVRSWPWTGVDISHNDVLPSIRAPMEAVMVVLLRYVSHVDNRQSSPVS